MITAKNATNTPTKMPTMTPTIIPMRSTSTGVSGWLERKFTHRLDTVLVVIMVVVFSRFCKSAVSSGRSERRKESGLSRVVSAVVGMACDRETGTLCVCGNRRNRFRKVARREPKITSDSDSRRAPSSTSP